MKGGYRRAPARLLLWLITGYRWLISPMLGPRCRFAPSCSAYAVDAIAEYGAVRGIWLSVRRIVRCHPFHPGGYDPVPPRRLRSPDRAEVSFGEPGAVSTSPGATEC